MRQSVIMEVQRLYTSVMYINRKSVLLFVWNIQCLSRGGVDSAGWNPVRPALVASGLVINERITVSF